MSEIKGAAPSVEHNDALHAALGLAMARIKEVPVSKNLVDSIARDAWENWDASGEIAMVSDDSDTDDEDFDELPVAA